MIVSSTITTRDNGLMDRITSVARSYNAKVEVGYLGNALHKPPITSKSSSSITTKALAAIHELGLGVPKRPFVEPALNKNSLKYIAYAGKEITGVIRRRKTANTVFKTIGSMAVADIKNYMMTANFTALAPSTIARKGSSKPLIETGQMHDGLEFKVK